MKMVNIILHTVGQYMAKYTNVCFFSGCLSTHLSFALKENDTRSKFHFISFFILLLVHPQNTYINIVRYKRLLCRAMLELERALVNYEYVK